MVWDHTLASPIATYTLTAVSPQAHSWPAAVIQSRAFLQQHAQSSHLMHKPFWLFLASKEQLFLWDILVSTSLQSQERLSLAAWAVINVSTFHALLLVELHISNFIII